MDNRAKLLSSPSFGSLLAQNWKMALGYCVVFVIAAVLFSCISMIGPDTGDFVLLVKIIQVIAFFALGYMLNLSLKSRRMPFLNAGQFQQRSFFAFLLACVILAVVRFFYRFVGEDFSLIVVASIAAFLLPFTVSESWISFRDRTAVPFKTWEYTPITPANQFSEYNKNLTIKLKIQTGSNKDIDSTIFASKVSEYMKLGVLFHLFVLEQNKKDPDAIPIKDRRGYPYQWVFFTDSMRGMSKKYFDPDNSLRQNEIAQNTIVNIVRLDNQAS